MSHEHDRQGHQQHYGGSHVTLKLDPQQFEHLMAVLTLPTIPDDTQALTAIVERREAANAATQAAIDALLSSLT